MSTPSSNATGVNGTTIAPEVAAFVSNSKALLVGGLVIGGVIVGVVVLLIFCCSVMKSRTSDETKEKKREKRKKEYTERRKIQAEEDARMSEKRKRAASKKRFGVVDKYDPNLDQPDAIMSMSFSSKSPMKKEDGSEDDDQYDDDDGMDMLSSNNSGSTVAPSLLMQRARGMSITTPSNKSQVGSDTSAVGDTSSMLNQSRPQSSVYALPAALSRRDGNSPPNQSAVVVIDEDDEATASRMQEEAELIRMQRDAQGYIHRSIPAVLSSSRRMPFPRNEREVQLQQSRHSVFEVFITQQLEEARVADEATRAVEEARLALIRKEQEKRAIDAKQLLSGLSTTTDTAAPLQRGALSKVASHSAERLRNVSTNEYFSRGM